MTHVTITNLSKTFPDLSGPAIDDLSLEIASGELTALLGPSGCGKTTAMKMIAGLLAPTSGDVKFDGRSILQDKPEDRGCVMVFQNHLLFPYMSVAENISFGLRMRKVPKAQIADKLAEMLSLVKLPDIGNRKPSELSGGQQQRVALARALIVQPRVLLLDEPLSSLDVNLRLEMRDLIRGLQKKLGITTVFVTHDQEEAVVLADRVALILDGRLCQYGPADHFYKRPADEAVAKFFGGQNFLQGQSDGAVFKSAVGPLVLPKGAPSGAGILTIRPEAIRIGAATANTLAAAVIDRIYLGTQTRLKLRVNETDLEAVLSPDLVDGINPGQMIEINLPPQSLWVMK